MRPPSPFDCPGEPVLPVSQETHLGKWTAEAAELHCFARFTTHFLRHHPGGYVIRDLEYRGIGSRTAVINRVLTALSQDFASFLGGNHWAKPDGLGISADGVNGQLMEVTTEKRYGAPRDRGHIVEQVRRKLSYLNGQVNQNHLLHTNWVGTSWRIDAGDKLEVPKFGRVCFRPSHRYPRLEPGITLYEVHPSTAKAPPPMPIHLPEELRDRIKVSIRKSPYRTGEPPLGWALGAVDAAPELSPLVLPLVAMAGVLLVATALTFELPFVAAYALVLALDWQRERLMPPVSGVEIPAPRLL